MPKVQQRDPKSGLFDEIEPDSADEDFEHEFEELCQNNVPGAKDDSDSEESGQFAHLKDDITSLDTKKIN